MIKKIKKKRKKVKTLNNNNNIKHRIPPQPTKTYKNCTCLKTVTANLCFNCTFLRECHAFLLVAFPIILRLKNKNQVKLNFPLLL